MTNPRLEYGVQRGNSSVLNDPEYMRVPLRPDEAATRPSPRLSPILFQDKPMLPTPTADAIHDEVLRLRRQYAHLLPKK